jgi:two-component system, NarL family, nitrate/nitrite response regulator NarL
VRADRATAPVSPQCPVVLVVDDHELFGSSLVLALESRGLAGHLCASMSLPDILSSADSLRRSLVLLDLDLGLDADGKRIDELALVAGFRRRGWATLVVSGATDERRVAAAIAAGAAGFVPKTAGLADLVDAVCRVIAGRPALTERERRHWLAVDRHSRESVKHDLVCVHRLTAREREVLECLAAGARATAIAEQFVVSLSTVRSQIRSILTKLDVNSQLEAVALLRRAVVGDGPS